MKILYIEDEIAHVDLTQRTLEDNLQDEFILYHRDSIKGALELLMAEPDIDLVLTDLRLPDGSGLELLKKMRGLQMLPAVVLVTGQGDQEIAVAALKAGAADYLVKQSDYLHRLPIVINNAVAQNRLLREQAALREAEVRYQSLVEHISAVVFLDAADEEETTIYISPRIEELTGYTPEEWRSDNLIWEKNIYPDDLERMQEADQRTHRLGERFQEEYRFIRRDGQVIWIKEDTDLVRDQAGIPLYWQGILLDITKEKRNETALQRQLTELTVLHAITIAGNEGNTEDEIVEGVIHVLGKIYNEACGVLLLNDKGDVLTPHPSSFGADISSWMEGYPITKGISGKTVAEGKTLRIGDVSREPDYIELTANVQSELSVPIRVNKEIIGVINVESRKLNAFDEEDEQFLNTVASTLGTSLERLRLFQKEQRRVKEINALYEATRPITQSLKPDVIAKNLLGIMDELLGYEIASIYLLDDRESVPFASGIQPKSAEPGPLRKGYESALQRETQTGTGDYWMGCPVRRTDPIGRCNQGRTLPACDQEHQVRNVPASHCKRQSDWSHKHRIDETKRLHRKRRESPICACQLCRNRPGKRLFI